LRGIFGESSIDISPPYLYTMQRISLKMQRCTEVQAIKNIEINQSLNQSSSRGTGSLEVVKNRHIAINQLTQT
jgi:hypothetical protein